MQKGKFSAIISAIHTPRIQIHDVNYSHGFITRGRFPKDCIMLGYVKSNAKVTFQNRVLQRNELVISTDSGEIDYLSTGENRVFTISVEKQLFLEAFFDFFAEPFDEYQAKIRFFIKPQMLTLFLKSINTWMTFSKSNHSLLLAEDKYCMAELEILGDIFTCLMSDQAVNEKSEFQIEKARDILHANIDERFNSMMLTHELGISQRQLQRLFKERYGISPKRYLLNLRINAVRKELLLADPKSATISEIALKYHFFDLNHFSKAYKLLFGELPSLTLLKRY
jgi:AraC family ethanolamine operon transcriptional activator